MFLIMQEGLDAAHFHEMAAKCRRLAATTNDPRAIDTLQKLAEEYDKAAQAAAMNGASHANGRRGPFRQIDQE
ncbi:MAG TPA: hypothetical protein VLM36_12175 [Sphingomicrobium sp.]|nr:hypothetical protein [Sphingomicrobium sp.]